MIDGCDACDAARAYQIWRDAAHLRAQETPSGWCIKCMERMPKKGELCEMCRAQETQGDDDE